MGGRGEGRCKVKGQRGGEIVENMLEKGKGEDKLKQRSLYKD